MAFYYRIKTTPCYKVDACQKLADLTLSPLRAFIGRKVIVYNLSPEFKSRVKKRPLFKKIKGLMLFLLFSPLTVPLMAFGLIVNSRSKTYKDLTFQFKKAEILKVKKLSPSPEKVDSPKKHDSPLEETSPAFEEKKTSSPISEEKSPEKLLPMEVLKENAIKKYGGSLVWDEPSHHPKKHDFKEGNLLVHFSPKTNICHFHKLENGKVRYSFQRIDPDNFNDSLSLIEETLKPS